MNNKKHIVIYSHGFGVQRDDRGLLTDIADTLPEIKSILFDYYRVEENKIYICPISFQVNQLNEIINSTRKNNPEATIDLIAHSQGTMVAAMARNNNIRKTVLLAPTFDMGIERTLKRYNAKQGVKIDLEGTSIIPSLKRLTKIIPKEYWEERMKIDALFEYDELTKSTEAIVIQANQDQLLPKVLLGALEKKMTMMSLDGNHNFEPPNRKRLLDAIRKILL